MNPILGLVSFVASPNPEALTAARNGLALAAAALFAEMRPMLDAERVAYLDEVMRHGGMLTAEQGIDGVGRTSTALCVVTANLKRIEIQSVFTPDRPAPAQAPAPAP